jgi:hypothetical protein
MHEPTLADATQRTGSRRLRVMDEHVEEFAASFEAFLNMMTRAAQQHVTSPIRDLLDEHLHTDAAEIPVVSDSFAAFDQVNVQVAISAFLAEEGRSYSLIGLIGQQRHYAALSDLLGTGHLMGVRVGAPDLVSLPTGPETSLECVQFGLYLIEDRGVRLACLVRGPSDHGDTPGVSIEILCPVAGHAAQVLAEIRSLMNLHNVFRGQVIAFGETSMGHRGIGMLSFFPRPEMSAEDLVLPEGVLRSVERHVIGIATARQRLVESGQHVKRGLLLHGPPGTGKTHTIRYLAANTLTHTVILLTGGALHMIRAAVGLARSLQPCIVVCEDVDLVAQERSYSGSGSGNPVLFEMLNVIDGIEPDADVVFVLTTNRVDLLEPALAARPGRVDLALEIPLPDASARRRLLELYSRGLEMRTGNVDRVIERTNGVTASFIKELMRKSALVAALSDGGTGRLTVTDGDLAEALDELLAEEGALTRILLGGGRGASRPGTEWLSGRYDEDDD